MLPVMLLNLLVFHYSLFGLLFKLAEAQLYISSNKDFVHPLLTPFLNTIFVQRPYLERSCDLTVVNQILQNIQILEKVFHKKGVVRNVSNSEILRMK